MKNGMLSGETALGRRPQNKFWLTFWLCFAGTASFLLPCVLVDKGIFHYAGDFNCQQIPFYYYANQFVKNGGGSFSWATDLGSDFWNSYSFYLTGSPFWWFTLLFPARALPWLMAPMLCLKMAVAGGYLWAKRYVHDPNYAVVAGCLYGLSGFSIYNIFFNHFLDVVALFPYLLWALDGALYEKRRGPFAALVALNLLNNYFFFVGQVVFLAIYFVCKVASGEVRLTGRLFGHLALESLLGCGMGCVLLIPELAFLLGNPRTGQFSSGYGWLMYGNVQQYFAIFASLFLPPETPFVATLFDEGTIKWTSLSCFLPLVGASGVIAWCRCTEKNAFKRMLCTCAVFALVPLLNSSYYAFNSSYYARWYYMPVLVMSLVTVLCFEHTDVVDLARGYRPTLILTALFALFALVPAKVDGEWQLGEVNSQPLFWARFAMGMINLLVFWLIWRGAKPGSVFPRRLLAGVLGMASVTGLLHVELAKFDQWFRDENYVQQTYYEAAKLDLPEGFYRLDAYECYDNISLWSGRPCLQFFNSTVEPSILEFYPSVGVKRDVHSKPELSNYALRGLLSVRFMLLPTDQLSAFREEADEGWAVYDTQGSYTILENENYVPMGFAVEGYVTPEEFEGVSKADRAKLLMRALVLDEEQAQQYAGLVRHLDDRERRGITYEDYTLDCADRKAESCSEFTADGSGFTAAITLEKARLVLFTVPWTKGFTATVNGQPAELLKVDNGLCALALPAGQSRIEVSYHTPGLRLSLAIGGSCTALWAGYTLYFRRKKRRISALPTGPSGQVE